MFRKSKWKVCTVVRIIILWKTKTTSINHDAVTCEDWVQNDLFSPEPFWAHQKLLNSSKETVMRERVRPHLELVVLCLLYCCGQERQIVTLLSVAGAKATVRKMLALWARRGCCKGALMSDDESRLSVKQALIESRAAWVDFVVWKLVEHLFHYHWPCSYSLLRLVGGAVLILEECPTPELLTPIPPPRIEDEQRCAPHISHDCMLECDDFAVVRDVCFPRGSLCWEELEGCVVCFSGRVWCCEVCLAWLSKRSFLTGPESEGFVLTAQARFMLIEADHSWVGFERMEVINSPLEMLWSLWNQIAWRNHCVCVTL